MLLSSRSRNAHKRLEEWQHQHPDATLDNKTRWQVITDASVEVGPALFISLLIITLSFIPIFVSTEGREGRLFGPLAFTKTYAMAGAALLAIVVIPILFTGSVAKSAGKRNPLNHAFDSCFIIRCCWKILHWPKTTLLVAALSVLTVLWPLNKVGGNFYADQ